ARQWEGLEEQRAWLHDHRGRHQPQHQPDVGDVHAAARDRHERVSVRHHGQCGWGTRSLSRHIRAVMKRAIGMPALLCVAPLAAQIPDAPAAYNQLRTPTSPAFVVLGVTPTAVERPNTPADIAFSILNSSGALTSLPKDVAIEFSPYWLFGHPKLEWRNDVKRGLGTSLARTATLSFATAELG